MRNSVTLTRRTPFVLLQTDYNAFSTQQPSTNRVSGAKTFFQFNFKRFKRFFKNSPYIPLIVVILFVGLVAFFAIRGMVSKSPQVMSAVQGDQRVAVKEAIAKQDINKTFTFPLKDEKGREVSRLLYTIQGVEKRNEIVVKGQKATAIKGRTFLIINLKITNNYDKAITINARDYVRLIINNSSEKLAADIHNDPVEVQAISTKLTRVGLAINDTDKNIVLQVGEIAGKKELITLDLK